MEKEKSWKNSGVSGDDGMAENVPLKRSYIQFFISYVHMELLGRVFVSETHVHNSGELMYVRSGSSIICCEDKITHASAPYIVYYPPDVPHTQENRANVIYERWCFPIFPADIGYSPDLPKHHFVISLTEEQSELFCSYAALLTRFWGDQWRTQAVSRTVQEDIRLRYLLLLFLNDMAPLIPSDVPRKSDYINSVCMYISEHPEQQLSLDALSERFFVGRTSLTREFRRRMNMSVTEFVTVSRVMHVKTLLGEGLPLGEIAERCGFSSVSYMIKVFRRQTGLTPSRYREKLSTQQS